MKIPFTFLVAINLFSLPIYADNPSPITVTANQAISSQETHSQAIATAVVEQSAKRWGLTVEEYRRYQDILQGPLGRWNPQIDPILALGIFADNLQEQQRYAEYFARQEYELITRTQAFEKAYRAAFRRLFPQAEMVNQSLLQPFYARQQKTQDSKKLNSLLKHSPRLKAGDRLLYFPDSQCKGCGKRVTQLFQRLSAFGNTGLDIFIRGITTDKAIRLWAATNQINPDWVNSGKVTLNQNNGVFEQIAASFGTTASNPIPDLYLNRNGKVFNLDKQQLGL